MVGHYLSVALLNFRKALIAALANLTVNGFVSPIELTLAPFFGCLLAVLLIAWLAVGSETLRTARTRPAQVLRHE